MRFCIGLGADFDLFGVVERDMELFISLVMRKRIAIM